MIYGTFHDSSDLIKRIPFFGITLDAGKHTGIHVFISVCSTALFCGAAWIFAVADPLTFAIGHFRASPFYTVRTAFLSGNTKMFHGESAVIRSDWISVFVVTDFFKGFHFWDYKESGFWKNGSRSAKPHKFQWYQRKNPQERYPDENRDEWKRSRKVRALRK